MSQISYEFNGSELVIRVPMDADRRPSGSGKSMIVASSGGAARLESPDGEDVRVNLNIYVPNN